MGREVRAELAREAERALLGAALLDRNAAVVLAEVDDRDWVVPDHAAIAQAVRKVTAAEACADVVLVAAELARQRPDVDLAALRELFAETPTISNAAKYADLVKYEARLRRLAHAGAQLAEAAAAGDEATIRRAATVIGREVAS